MARVARVSAVDDPGIAFVLFRGHAGYGLLFSLDFHKSWHRDGGTLIVKDYESTHFLNEIITARRDSPLLIGLKTDIKLKVEYATADESANLEGRQSLLTLPAPSSALLASPAAVSGPKMQRSQSRAFISEDGIPQPVEFFIASDAFAIIEHTKRVLYLEDDDIAHIVDGQL
ncbi:hypothetical protein M422DRAFT_246142 [Sphaerobolus stellatus SS14]|nr:hypothetical protein M422DRAFT_246142 [Sphaerobolus stellatus SS14]